MRLLNQFLPMVAGICLCAGLFAQGKIDFPTGASAGTPVSGSIRLFGNSTTGYFACTNSIGGPCSITEFFGTSAPGSVAGNLPGDLFNDTTNHNLYWCNAIVGTGTPACTSVSTGGWTLLNGAGTGSIFSSYQFGGQTAITGIGNYIQLTYPALFTTTQSGSGTSGSPYINALTLSTQAQNSVFAGPPTGGAGIPTFQTAPTFSAANLTNFPIFNQTTTGTAAGLTSYPTLCSGAQFSQGLSSGSNNCATPSGGGNVSASGGPSQYQIATWVNGTSIGGVSVGTAGRVLIDQGASAYPSFNSFSQDCTITSAGAVTCLKTNNVAFGTAATVNIGTSGATLPLLNGTNNFSGINTFSGGTITASPSLGVGSSPLTETWTVGAGGVTQYTLVQTDTSAPLKMVASTTGAYGVAMATVSAAGSVEVARYGTVLCVADNATTAGDLAILGTGSTIYVRDSGQTSSSAIPISTRIIGVFRSSVSGGQNALVELTPAHFGTQVSSGGGNAYASTLTVPVISNIACTVAHNLALTTPFYPTASCFNSAGLDTVGFSSFNTNTLVITDASTETISCSFTGLGAGPGGAQGTVSCVKTPMTWNSVNMTWNGATMTWN